MKKTLNLVLILITLSLFTSCESDTDIEIVQNQLQSFVKENKITKCTIIVLDGEYAYTDHQNVDFTIEKGFVVINGNGENNKVYQERYNLMFLSKYLYNVDNRLVLYFYGTQF